jgi:hypothetical protein
MILNLNPTPSRRVRKKPGVFLFLIAVASGALFIGNTLAGNISLNSGTAVEFGQGVVQATACDNEISINPISTFMNSSEGGSYGLTALNFSGIDSSSDHCARKDFYIHAYYKNSTGPENIIDSVSEIIVRDSGRDFAVDAIAGLVMLSTNSDSFSLTFATNHSLLDAKQLDRITIESRDHIYSVGSIGPGGGIVFYISDSTFSCGPTQSEQCNALEYPPTGVVPGSIVKWAPPEGSTTEVGAGARYTSIGSGYKNSVSIVHQYTELDGIDQGTYQAGVMRLFSGGGLTDWYMPSRDEIFELYRYTQSNHLSAPMAYGNSSSEVSAISNWGIYFPIANQVPTQTGSKRDVNPSCPIRAFVTARS